MDGVKRALNISLVSALVAAALALPASYSVAAETFQVAVGRFLSGAGAAESLSFFPDELRIHQGDTVRFTSDGFHSVALLPLGETADEWLSEHWEGRSGPWSLVRPDPDEGADASKLNPLVALPARIDCGQAGQTACRFDGEADPVEGVLNSGLPGAGPMALTVTIDAPAGETLWAVDLVTGMSMRIEVVAASAPASTSQEISAANAAQEQADTEAAARLHRTYSKKREKTTKGGKVTWKAWAGVDGDGLVLRSMYPKSLPINKGHSVQWQFSKLVFDAHTVTFPTAEARALMDAFPEIACDADGDTGSSPDNAQEQPSPPFCDDPRHLELDIPNELVNKQGGSSIATATSFAHSGVRGALPLATSKAPFKLRFTKASGKKGFSYACALHPTMTGKVVVK